MPFIMIVRALLSLLGLAILAAAGWLLWTWYQGDYIRDVYGVAHLVRHDWQLWTALGLILWSFGGGGILIKPFLARSRPSPEHFKRGDGEIIAGVNGASLYVETTGRADAPTVILTHGWGLDSTIWAAAKRDLSRDFRVISWDLPGMGKSKAPNAAVGLESFADNLAAVMAYADAEKVVLVGHSIGGMTTQTLARDHGDIVRRHVAGIVLVNTTYVNPLQTMILSPLVMAMRLPIVEPMMHLTMWLAPFAWLGAWKSYLDGTAHIANRLGFGPRVTHAQLEHTTLLSVRNPQGAQAKGNLAMFHWNSTGAVAKLDVPILVLGGKVDIVTKPEASQDIAASARHAGVVIVDDANHMGFAECADVYNKAIAAFATDAFAAQRRETAKAS